MTDRAFEPASPDPFDQFDPDKVGVLPPKPRAQRTDSLAQFDPYPDEEIVGFGAPSGGDSSTLGAFGRGAARGAAPAAGSLAGFGAGAEAGFVGGGLIGGPFAEFTAPVGGVIGGLAGGYFGAEAVGAAQHWALSKLPDSWREKIGMDDRQEQLDQTEHSTASFLGGLAPFAVTMQPGKIAAGTLPENATALQRIMAHPATKRVFGAAVMGGFELGQEAIHGESPDWTNVAVATGFGLVFNKPTRIGEGITEVGAQPARALLAPARALLYRLHPTLAQASDLNVAGPGVTKEVFEGSHERDSAATQAAQETARTEQDTIGEPKAPSPYDVARRMEPETFKRWDALQGERNSIRTWIEQFGGTDSAYRNLHEVSDEMVGLEPQVKAAYRRAAEATGTPFIEPEPPEAPVAAVAEPAPPLPPAPEAAAVAAPVAPVKPIEEQKAGIVADVKRRLMAGNPSRNVPGRPADEAESGGRLTAARYEALANWFEGKLGTAEEIYEREAPEIRWHGERSDQTPQPRGRRTVNEEKLSLTQFLAHRGGLKPTGDLKSIFDRNPFMPGHGSLFRETGMTLDRAREAAVEAGYINPSEFIGRAGGENTTKISDLLNALQEEARGRKVYRPGHEPEAARDAEQEAHEREAHEDQYEAIEPHEVGPQNFDALPDEAIWGRFMADRTERREDHQIATGRNDTLGRTGAPIRGAATQAWTPGNVVDIGFVKNRLVSEVRPDGTFTLLSKPDAEGLSQVYSVKPQEGLVKEGKVNFREAVRPLWREEMRETAPSHLTEEDRRVMAELFQAIPGIHIRGGTPGNELFQIQAHHGSPHEFDKFDIDRIGTGEGAQVYGHGLYFAENQQVSESYLRAGRDDVIGAVSTRDGPAFFAASALSQFGSDTAAAVRSLKGRAHFAEEDDAASYLEAAKMIESGWKTPEAKGNLYKVNIKAEPDHLLDWDKPLSEQSQFVKDRLGALIEASPEREWMKARGNENLPASEFYDALVRDPATGTNDSRAASKALREAGIAGIKYLDRGSRAGGEGTRNFVVFDHNDIDITHRNGQPVAGAEAEAARQHIKEDSEASAGNRELFQRDEAPESHEAGRRNAQGFILRLPYADRWGDPRFNPEDRAKALARMAEIEKMPVKTAPWADLVQAKHDIDEVIAQLLYYKPERPVEEFRNFSDVEYEMYLRRKKQNLGHDDGSRSHLDLEGVPEDIRDIVGSARAALDHLVATDRRGVDQLLNFGKEGEPSAPRRRGADPTKIGETLPSGFHFMAGRKLAEVPDALFPQGGWAVINWLRQEGVTVAEVQHFLLDEKLGNKKPVTREDFQQAIAARMFDFKRKTSWLNPERSDSEYDYGGTRAFTGPRIPGRGMYFERLMAFPKKLKGGDEFAPGSFESPHWQDVHKGTWASWRGSVREIPEWGKTVLGEEGQSDFMQGASVGKRPRIAEKEYLALKAERPKYEEAIQEARRAYNTISLYLRDIPASAEARRVLDNALSYGTHNRAELNRTEWDTAIDALRHDVEQIDKSAPAYEYKIKSTREAIDKLADLRAADEKFFEPGATDKYASTESSFTPESPIDETYVRTMVRDLVMQAIKEKADSIAIATSETTGRIQNNDKAAHFYDEQLRPALQRELRRLTGDGSITLEKVKLPKAMGAPRNEKPYTVWAAKLGEDVREGVGEPGFPLFQRVKGSYLPREGDRPLISMMRTADASTFMHESAHDWLEQLMRFSEHPLAPDEMKADAETVKKWLGIEGRDDLNPGMEGERGDRARAAHEKFATGFEQYLREGVAPSKELAGIFAKFKQWLIAIYKSLQGLGEPINDDIRGVFDRLLSASPERTIVSAEHPPQDVSLLHHIHPEDARLIEPAEAEHAMNRTLVERDRLYEDLPEEVKAEFEANLAETAAAEAEGWAGTNPSGEAGAGAGRSDQVDGARGKPEPVATGSVGGPEPRDIGAGIGDAGAEGARVSGAAPAAERRPDDAGPALRDQPLAPRPADTFKPSDAFNVGKNGNVRVENITSVPQLVQAIDEAAQRIPGGGAITMGDMLALADDLALDPSTISEAHLARMFGGVQNLSAKIWKLRTAVKESSQIVIDSMKRAGQSGADADLAAMAEAMARHDMMQSVLSSVTTETGRGLGMSFRNLEGWEKAQDLKTFLEQNTGRTLFQLQRMAKLGAQLDSPAKVSKFLRDAQKRSFGKMVLEYWINGLISGVATHMTYAEGNMILALWKAVPETLTAAAIGKTREALGRPGERIRAGEALAGPRAMLRGLPAAAQAMIEAGRTGQTTLLPGETAHPLMPFQGDTTLVTAKNLTNDPVTWREVGGDAYALLRGVRDAFTTGSALLKAGGAPGAPVLGFNYSPLGQIPDIAYRGVTVLPLGSAIRIPGRGVAAIHSFFRTLNYLREGAAEAYRTAANEGLEGTAFASRVADIRTNPSAEQMERWRYGATELTLMGQGGKFVKAMSQLTNATVDLPLLGETAPLKFIDPFVHIGANVIKQAVVERTPIGILSAEIRADLMGRNGNVAQDMAAARMLAGTAVSLLFGGLAMEGLATGSGPTEPNKSAMWRLAGYQAHSVRIGDIWYDVHRLGPMGMLLGIAADMADVAHEAGKGEMLTAASHLQHAIMQNILDESFMRGPSDLIKAVDDPGRYGEAYLRTMLSSFVPFSVGMAQMARAADPYSRQARTVMDAIKAKIPGMSETLMPRRDIWGDEVPSLDALVAKGLTAIYMKRISADPVNIAMLELGIAPAKVERTIRNVQLTDQQYDDFARIAGRTTKMRLDAIVRSPDWRTWPNHVKHDVIQESIRQSREAGRSMVMMKYPQIIHDATDAKLKKMRGE